MIGTFAKWDKTPWSLRDISPFNCDLNFACTFANAETFTFRVYLISRMGYLKYIWRVFNFANGLLEIYLACI